MRNPRALRLVNHGRIRPREAVTPLTKPLRLYARRIYTAGSHFRVSEPLLASIVPCSDWPVPCLDISRRPGATRALSDLFCRCRSYSAVVSVSGAEVREIFASWRDQADVRGPDLLS